jgi:hypothetical protein
VQHARGGRRNLRVHLIGGNLEQRFVALYLLAWLLQPLRDCAFEYRFPHLGHDYVGRHDRSSLLKLRVACCELRA